MKPGPSDWNPTGRGMSYDTVAVMDGLLPAARAPLVSVA